MLTLCLDVTLRVVALNLTLELPAVMNTLEGTCSTVELLLETENENPFDGATDPGNKTDRDLR